MRYYIATSLDNHAAHNRLRDELTREGWELTYDWTTHGSLHAAPEAAICRAARAELRGVRDADVVVVLLPGGAGTHTELGYALATQRPVVIYAPELPENGRYPSFYRLCQIVFTWEAIRSGMLLARQPIDAVQFEDWRPGW